MRIKDLHSPTTYEIEVTKKSGEETMLCPKCSHTRKKSKDRCLSWNIEKEVGYCNHCSSSFVKYQPLRERVHKEYRIPEWKNLTELSDKAAKWFESRGISQATLRKMRIYTDRRFMRIKMPSGNVKEVQNAEVIAFPFFMPFEEKPRNIKYRGANKSFGLESGAELIFYNFEAIADYNSIRDKYLIIVEGEIDTLSFIEAGFNNVVSVPNGAGAKDLSYLDNYIDEIDQIDKFYIAVDFDEAGLKLREELIRRLGAEKCSIVTFEGFKDVNELLIEKGSAVIKRVLDNAVDVPLRGEVEVDALYDKLQSLYQNGLPTGAKLNFKPIDDLIGWETGRLAIWSGIPSHGKSNVIDFVSIRLNMVNGWKTAFWTPENFPIELHIANLAEKVIGKRFKTGTMNQLEFDAAFEYVRDNFFWINPEENTTAPQILDVAKQLVKRKGIKHLVIDPLNALAVIGSEESRTMQIEALLRELTAFCRKYNVLLSLVAHPRKMDNDGGRMRVPTMYDISGSSTFFDKADYGLVVYRWFDRKMSQLFVQKVKFRNLGHINETENDGLMMFNMNNGRYSEPTDPYAMDNRNYLEVMQQEGEFEYFDDGDLPAGDFPTGVDDFDLPM